MHLNSIIIPTFNNFRFSIKCILSIFQNSSDFNFEIIIVDNGSTDDTLTWANKLQAQGKIQLIANPCNFGFARACNQGALHAKGKFLVFLNNDTEVLPGWLQGLHNCSITDQNIGLVGGKLLYPDNTIQHAGIAFDKQKVFHIYRHFHPLHPAVNKRREFQAVTGACLFVRRDLFITLGMFDEEFQNGFEDLDFCFRARKNRFKVLYSPECSVIHHESKTPGRHAHHHENAKIFTERWQSDISYDINVIYQQDGLRQILSGEDNLKGKWFEDANKNPFWQLAKSLCKSGKLKDAEEAFKQALRFNPFDLRRLNIAEELGDLYLSQQNLTAAKTCYEAIATAHPSSHVMEKLKMFHRADCLP